ncbi:MAG: tetratricopeptide repeat protein [Candidatus Magnetomorum sp.]|nr:tetratricopeptide repeat protein [Candidatus Magnetomorum sp.]
MTHPFELLRKKGLFFKNNGQYQDAVHCFEEALTLCPDDIETINLLGESFIETGELKKGQQCFFKTIQLQSNCAQGHTNLAKSFFGQNDFHQALYHALEALPSNKNNDGFLYFLGLTFQKISKYKEAIKYYQESINLNPNLSVAWNNLGIVYTLLGQLTNAEHIFKQGIQRFPDNYKLLLNLGRCYDEQGQSDTGLFYYSKAASLTERESQARSNLLFALHYQMDLTPENLYRAHCSWAVSTKKKDAFRNALPTHPIHIGYVSSDFKLHPVSSFFYSILLNHDQERFQLFCYAHVDQPDAMTEKMKQCVRHWRNISMLSDDEVYHLIQKDRIHILVDLSGHSDNSRLRIFTMQPAPIQVTYLGYPGTTGLNQMDYRITDAWADPPENDAFNSETLIRMPHCFLCYTPLIQFLTVNALPAQKNGFITLGSLNRLPKINSQVLEIWAQILLNIPRSHLVLKSMAFNDTLITRRMWAFFENKGIDKNRIELIHLTNTIKEHLLCYHQIDIALDTFPYNGTTTTCEALWMGVPVITLEGKAHVSRVTTSILKNIGLTECIARTTDDYIHIAIALSKNINLLSHMRQHLRTIFKASPLSQANSFVAALEEKYLWMLQNKGKHE